MATAVRPNDKARIIEHYNVVSPYYRSLWGELHHGYWITGNESKEQAQLQLLEHLAGLANIPRRADVLDVGCGYGGASLFLARKFDANVTGITISQVQVDMANQAAAEQGLSAKFLLMDAEAITLQQKFDVLWSVESISHYHDRAKFFAQAACKLLKPGGTFAITDWFKKENLTPVETRKFIQPINEGMFIELQTMQDYERYFTQNGLRITHRQVLNRQCAKTWDISVDIIKDKNFWALAARLGTHFVTYLRSFQVVRAGFASGNFVYGLFVATSE